MSLPSGYKQVNYIENNQRSAAGSMGAYINLPTFTCDKWQIECEILNNISGEQCILGNRDNGSANRWELYADDGSYQTYTLFASETNLTSTTPYYRHAVIEYDDRYESFTVNGNRFGPLGLSLQPKYIFQYGNNNYAARGRVYSFKAWNEGVLVIDLVPCRRLSDNAAGMYDLVGGSFRKSARSYVDFAAGPDTEPEYGEFAFYHNNERYNVLNLGGEVFSVLSDTLGRDLSDYMSMSETIEYDWYDIRIYNNTGQPISIIGELLIDDSDGQTTHVNVNVQFDTIEQFYDLSYESGTGCNISDVYYHLVFKSPGFNDYIKEYNWE